jgi:hypothetical protein
VAGRAEVAQAAIAATEVNTAALAKTRTDLQQAEPLKTSDPTRYAQIQQQSQVTVAQSEQNLRHLQDMLVKYRLKPYDFPAGAVDLRRLDPNKQLTGKPVEANSGGLGRETVKIPTTPQPEDWSAKCSKWIAELDQVNNQIAGTRAVLLKLNASIQTDRTLFDEWEKAATDGFDRCVDLAVGVAIDTGLGYLVDRYDDINSVAATLPDPKGVEKYRLITSLFKRLEEAKGTKDVADLAASEGKTDAEFFEMLRDGIGQIAELVGPDKWFPARVWRYGSLGWDMAYNLTELGLVWKNVSVLEANNARYAEAVRKLAERMQELIKRQKELIQKIEAGEPVDYSATDK